MSTEQSSSNKWLIGCLIAGAVGVLLCGGVVVFFGLMGYRAAQQFGPEFNKQMQQIQYAQTWQGPEEDAGPEQLFPPAIGAWTLSGHDDAAAIPELAIDRDGLHGTYESAGTTINVYAYRVPMTEQTQVFDAAAAAIDGAGYTTQQKSNVDLGSWHLLTFSFNPPEKIGRMWWANEWLFVTMTETPAANLEGFETDYLDAIQTSSSGAVEELEQYTPPQLQEPEAPVEPVPVEPQAEATESAPGEPEAAPSDPETAEPAPADPDAQETAPAEPTPGN